MKKYASVEELAAAAKAGEFTGNVIVDNDCVDAYQDGENVFDFDGEDPGGALIKILEQMGIKADYA